MRGGAHPRGQGNLQLGGRRRIRVVRLICLAVFGWLLTGSALGFQTPSSQIPGHVMVHPPTIDGVVDLEKEWAGVPGGSGAFDDQTGAPAPEGMQFRIAYDSKFIYFGVILEDSSPDQIRAVEYRTNSSLGGDDHVELQLDPFGNFSDRHRFRINPRGASDLSVPGGTANKREWQGEFIAAGRITATGWEAEARIPWSVMRLPAAGTRSLRINVSRELQRLNREFEWRDTSRNQVQNAGYWTDVAIPSVDQDRRILALPYSYAGADADGATLDAGIDLKGRLSDQLEAVMTVNPDFRNVENQILSLDFSYFERLAGEARPFFLEGQGYLGGGRGSRIFASQRLEKIDVGAKVFGKLTEQTSVGVLAAFDFGGATSYVGDLSQRLGDRSSISASFAGDERGGNSNFAGSLDFYAGSGSFSVYGSHMATRDNVRGYGSRSSGGLSYDDGYWEASLNYSATTPDLFPRIGFAPETDYKGLNASLRYSKPYASGPIEEIQFGANRTDQTTMDGAPYRTGDSVSAEITMRNGPELQARTSRQTFRGFDDRSYRLEARWPRGNPYNNWRIETSWGRVGGRDYVAFGPGFSYRPSGKLQVRGSFEYLNRDGAETQTVLGANYDFDEYRAVAARFVQRDSDLSFYLAFRQSGNAGNEYYLIVGDPNSDTFRPSVIFKAAFPVEFRF